jgi:hypothetical protein
MCLSVTSLLDLLHIIPVCLPLSLIPAISFLIDVLSSKVFSDYGGSLNIWVIGVLCAIFSITHAISSFVCVITILAAIYNVSGCHQDRVSKHLVYSCKVRQEVHCLVVSLSEPEVILYSVVWSRNVELSDQSELSQFFF